uniref:(California timema) hypothetical protein n=1 Tax=Timema californicum TaxID=61474 RepID=A0A7R9JA22_TIMCA|nr:unnamed protein product [Timema californicum]
MGLVNELIYSTISETQTRAHDGMTLPLPYIPINSSGSCSFNRAAMAPFRRSVRNAFLQVVLIINLLSATEQNGLGSYYPDYQTDPQGGQPGTDYDFLSDLDRVAPPEKGPYKPEVYDFHVMSRIQLRYATTVVSSKVVNPANFSQQYNFSVVIPEESFISGFEMTIDDQPYKAYVLEKRNARKRFKQAVSEGRAAAYIAQTNSSRSSQRFSVSLNLEPLSKVNFILSYEELLTRKLYGYKYVININPRQIVPNLLVEVRIDESCDIIYVKVPAFRHTDEIQDDNFNSATENNYLAEVEHPKPRMARVRWSASPQQQKDLNKEGVKGQLVILYDVDRTSHQDQVLVISEQYFVHFFAPADLIPMRKHVTFVLDTSSSMFGEKLQQIWSPSESTTPKSKYSDYYRRSKEDKKLTTAVVVPASNPNIAKAKAYLHNFEAGGSATNINGALKKAFKVAQLGKKASKTLESYRSPSQVEKHVPPESMIIFLTDGQPTVGKTNSFNIVNGVCKKLNKWKKVSLFSLGFGSDVDMELLKMLSLKNSGFARRIYEASDAALQLRDFYREISSPLLANVTFRYVKDLVEQDTVTRNHFPQLYQGSELVVAGKVVVPGSEKLSGTVTYRAVDGPAELGVPEPETIQPWLGFSPGFMERMWAYLTIQQLLQDATMDTKHAAIKKQRAVRLALKVGNQYFSSLLNVRNRLLCYLHLRGGRLESHFGKTTLSTTDQDSNPNHECDDLYQGFPYCASRRPGALRL